MKWYNDHMENVEVFEKQYKRLTNRQREAVDTVEGPVMVIAGPGTGKTTILTLRVANILRVTDTSPRNILALTFTESAGYAMRRKLKDIIGPSAYKVNIYTFHGFAEEIIQTYPEYFPEIIGSNHINEIDQVRILEEIFESNQFEYLKSYGNPLFYVRPCLSMISDLKREDISPEDLKIIIEEQEKEFEEIEDLCHEKGRYKGKMKGDYKKLLEKIEKNKDLHRVYDAYQEYLKEHNLRDFNDMIMVVVRTLNTDEDLKLRLQEEYQYILADEHQDANRAQNKLLEHLTSFHENPNLFIVGDEKQAIFRFQGASLENFLYFKERFPEGVHIVLDQNFRSHQEILDYSHSLIEYNKVPFPELRLKLEAFHGSAQKHVPITLHSFQTEEYEHRFIAENIAEKLEKGSNPNEIAVLYKNNRDVELLMPHLEEMGIPYVVESKSSILSDIVIEKLILLMRAVNAFGEGEYISKILQFDFLGLDPLDVYRLHVYRQREWGELIEILSSKEKLKEAGIEDVESFQEIYEELKKTHSDARNIPLISLFPRILSRFGITRFLLSEGVSNLESYRKITALFGKIKELSQVHKNYSLEEFLSYTDSVIEHGLDLNVHTHTDADVGVRLMTAHKSKGLEFDTVYITRLVDKHWGNKRSRSFFHIPVEGLKSLDVEVNEDERRLLYVALTRARKEVVLTNAHTNYEGGELVPSQFLAELDSSLVEEINHETYRPLTATVHGEKRVRTELRSYITHLFFERGLAVTALNNYLACPWRYFYNNLLRVPEVPSRHQTYGVAIHNALRDFFSKYARGDNPSKKELLSNFDLHLKRASFSGEEIEDGTKRGHDSLSGYYDEYEGTWGRNLMLEYDVRGVPFEIIHEEKTEELLLKGKLDKVEFLDTEGSVSVVDYKTGEPKSRGVIEGTTKNSNGDYKRQLVFYKLLLDSYADGKYKMESGIIDFVEPNKSGKYKKERYIIKDTEVEELRDIIQSVAQEILSLSFWDKRCDDTKCQYCRMRDMSV